MLEASLRRDRLVILAALLLLTALAWAYLVHLNASMAAAISSMPGMDMTMNMGPAPSPWNTEDFVFAVIMWAVMMIGMMAPSVAPTILLYARVGRLAAAQHQPFAATGWFASGYFLAWAGFSLAAAAAQTALGTALLLTPTLKSASASLSGAVLVVAGLYQWSPWKNACLEQCRAPLFFIQRHGGFRKEASRSLLLGLRHGLYCVGCCWALMLLLFVAGVMNLFWIAVLAALVLIEKLWVRGVLVSRAFGVAAIAGGVFLIAQRWV